MNYLPLGMEFFLVLAMGGVVILVLLTFDVLSYATGASASASTGWPSSSSPP